MSMLRAFVGTTWVPMEVLSLWSFCMPDSSFKDSVGKTKITSIS